MLWAAFSMLRVYAINGRDWRTPALVLIFGLVPFGTNVYNYTREVLLLVVSDLGPVSCFMSSLDQFGTQNKFQIATRVCIIISDAVVLLVTWRVTFGVKRVADKERVNVSVTTLLLRDGTTYFGVLFVINIIDIVLCVTQIFPNVSLFSEVFTSVLLCRFFLNLRQVYTSGGDSQFLPSQMSDVRSASKFVGNLGAPLMHGPSGHGLSPSDWDSDSDSDLFLMDNDDPAMEEMNTDNDDLAFRENQERDEVLFGMIEISRVVNEPLKDGLGLSHEYLSLPSMDHDYDWF